MMGAWPGAVAAAVTLRFGDTPGSELGGEPNAAGIALTTAPQLNVPGSDGGVKVARTCSTCARAALGLVATSLAAASACG
jgi:uncharacterized membrane protein